MKILQGVYQTDSGSILVGGKPVEITSIQDAKAAGIGMVFQEFSLVPSLTVAQNIFLGAEPQGRSGLIDDREAVRRAREVFTEMEVEVDPHVSEALGTNWRYMKGCSPRTRLLIMTSRRRPGPA
jgi:ribose transport system ATP-binding protein